MDTPPLTPEAPPTPAVPPVASTHWAIQIIGGVLVAAILILGGWLYFRSSAPVASPSPTPSATADAMAGWETYTNTQYGYTIAYPASYFFDFADGQNEVLRIQDKKYPSGSYEWPRLEVSVSQPTALPSLQWLNQYLKDQRSPQVFPTPTTKTIGQLTVLTTTLLSSDAHQPLETYSVIRTTDSRIVLFSCLYGDPQCDQILSTFQFTGASSTCMPRPACLDATPRCLIAEPAEGWCQ